MHPLLSKPSAYSVPSSTHTHIGMMPHTDRAGDTGHLQILVFIQTFM